MATKNLATVQDALATGALSSKLPKTTIPTELPKGGNALGGISMQVNPSPIVATGGNSLTSKVVDTPKPVTTGLLSTAKTPGSAAGGLSMQVNPGPVTPYVASQAAINKDANKLDSSKNAALTSTYGSMTNQPANVTQAPNLSIAGPVGKDLLFQPNPTKAEQNAIDNKNLKNLNSSQTPIAGTIQNVYSVDQSAKNPISSNAQTLNAWANTAGQGPGLTSPVNSLQKGGNATSGLSMQTNPATPTNQKSPVVPIGNFSADAITNTTQKSGSATGGLSFGVNTTPNTSGSQNANFSPSTLTSAAKPLVQTTPGTGLIGNATNTPIINNASQAKSVNQVKDELEKSKADALAATYGGTAGAGTGKDYKPDLSITGTVGKDALFANNPAQKTPEQIAYEASLADMSKPIQHAGELTQEEKNHNQTYWANDAAKKEAAAAQAKIDQQNATHAEWVKNNQLPGKLDGETALETQARINALKEKVNLNGGQIVDGKLIKGTVNNAGEFIPAKIAEPAATPAITNPAPVKTLTDWQLHFSDDGKTVNNDKLNAYQALGTQAGGTDKQRFAAVYGNYEFNAQARDAYNAWLADKNNTATNANQGGILTVDKGTVIPPNNNKDIVNDDTAGVNYLKSGLKVLSDGTPAGNDTATGGTANIDNGNINTTKPPNTGSNIVQDRLTNAAKNQPIVDTPALLKTFIPGTPDALNESTVDKDGKVIGGGFFNGITYDPKTETNDKGLTNDQFKQYVDAHLEETQAKTGQQFKQQMKENHVTPEQVADIYNIPVSDVLRALESTATLKQFFTPPSASSISDWVGARPSMNGQDLALTMKNYNISPAQLAASTGHSEAQINQALQSPAPFSVFFAQKTPAMVNDWLTKNTTLSGKELAQVMNDYNVPKDLLYQAKNADTPEKKAAIDASLNSDNNFITGNPNPYNNAGAGTQAGGAAQGSLNQAGSLKLPGQSDYLNNMNPAGMNGLLNSVDLITGAQQASATGMNSYGYDAATVDANGRGIAQTGDSSGYAADQSEEYKRNFLTSDDYATAGDFTSGVNKVGKDQIDTIDTSDNLLDISKYKVVLDPKNNATAGQISDAYSKFLDDYKSSAKDINFKPYGLTPKQMADAGNYSQAQIEGAANWDAYKNTAKKFADYGYTADQATAATLDGGPNGWRNDVNTVDGELGQYGLLPDDYVGKNTFTANEIDRNQIDKVNNQSNLTAANIHNVEDTVVHAGKTTDYDLTAKYKASEIDRNKQGYDATARDINSNVDTTSDDVAVYATNQIADVQAAGKITDGTGRVITNPGENKGYDATTLKDANKWDITDEQTSAGQLNKILAQDSPLMQRARTTALQAANARGLLNSSIAVGASQDAMVNAASQLALNDANTYAKSSNYNADSSNTFKAKDAEAENAAKSFTATAKNAIAQQNAQSDLAVAKANSDAMNAAINSGYGAIYKASADDQSARNQLYASNQEATNAAKAAKAASQARIDELNATANTEAAKYYAETLSKQNQLTVDAKNAAQTAYAQAWNQAEQQDTQVAAQRALAQAAAKDNMAKLNQEAYNQQQSANAAAFNRRLELNQAAQNLADTSNQQYTQDAQKANLNATQQMRQFNVGNMLEADKLNSASSNQAAQDWASAANRQRELNVAAENQAELANTAATNQALQFQSEAKNAADSAYALQENQSASDFAKAQNEKRIQEAALNNQVSIQRGNAQTDVNKYNTGLLAQQQQNNAQLEYDIEKFKASQKDAANQAVLSAKQQNAQLKATNDTDVSKFNSATNKEIALKDAELQLQADKYNIDNSITAETKNAEAENARLTANQNAINQANLEQGRADTDIEKANLAALQSQQQENSKGLLQSQQFNTTQTNAQLEADAARQQQNNQFNVSAQNVGKQDNQNNAATAALQSAQMQNTANQYNADAKNAASKANAATQNQVDQYNISNNIENEQKNTAIINTAKEYNAKLLADMDTARQAASTTQSQNMFLQQAQMSLNQINNDAKFNQQMLDSVASMGANLMQNMHSLDVDTNLDQNAKDYYKTQMIKDYANQLAIIQAVGSVDLQSLITVDQNAKGLLPQNQNSIPTATQNSNGTITTADGRVIDATARG